MVTTKDFFCFNLPGRLKCYHVNLCFDAVQAYVQGWVVWKLVNANPGLKFNRGNDFSSIKILSTAYVLKLLLL